MHHITEFLLGTTFGAMLLTRIAMQPFKKFMTTNKVAQFIGQAGILACGMIFIAWGIEDRQFWPIFFGIIGIAMGWHSPEEAKRLTEALIKKRAEAATSKK